MNRFAPNLIQTPRIRSLDSYYPQNSYLTKSKMVAAAILKITFLAITRPFLHAFAPSLKHRLTRQHSYRKEDRAMRPIFGCPEKFSESALCTRLLFQKFVMDFVPIDTRNVRTKVEVRSFTRSWDNMGYSKNLGSPWICPRSIFSQNFKGLLFVWTLWIYLPNLTFVGLPIPEIIGGTSKSWGIPGFAHALYSPKFLKGFCSHGPCEYTCQFWIS